MAASLNPQPTTAFAQGTVFTYQGRLNSGANPASGVYDLRFAVVNDDNGGVPLGGWLTNSATGVSNGLFTVTLDFGKQFPGSPRWIEVGVRTNGGGAFTTLVPRQRLTATPYAVTAETISEPLPAGQITGTLPLAQLPASVVTNGASGVNVSGSFIGSGAGITNMNLALNSGGTSSQLEYSRLDRIAFSPAGTKVAYGDSWTTSSILLFRVSDGGLVWEQSIYPNTVSTVAYSLSSPLLAVGQVYRGWAFVEALHGRNSFTRRIGGVSARRCFRVWTN